MYRRKIIGGLSPGQPDRLHLHQVIYRRLSPSGTEIQDPASITKYNSRVAPFAWLLSVCCALPAILLWRETRWLVTASIVFCGVYLFIYHRLAPPARKVG